MALLKVQPIDGHEHLLKDTDSKAVINADTVGFDTYIKKREKQKELFNKVNDLETDINSIKSDINTILSLLQKKE